MAERNSFPEGNKLAKGGARARSGPKTADIKQAEAAIFSALEFEVATRGKDGKIELKDGKPALRKATLIHLAGETIAQAMADRDENGNVTMAGVRAAEMTMNRVYGKPRQAITIDSTGKNPIEDAVALLGAVTKGEIDDVFDAPTKGKRGTKRGNS